VHHVGQAEILACLRNLATLWLEAKNWNGPTKFVVRVSGKHFAGLTLAWFAAHEKACGGSWVTLQASSISWLNILKPQSLKLCIWLQIICTITFPDGFVDKTR